MDVYAYKRMNGNSPTLGVLRQYREGLIYKKAVHLTFQGTLYV